ncbi:hypothetical protein EK21DRAFT_95445 [Setomelanomma holmii]|uniref:Uncharacterized protein n=1 Tax=Setomelanomma holmii TaxID=210430 RepID=A0A9P4LG15_9PLEO|nr:hypothetical protein EK21DRAFT_95445 [Setomelanomma holmii]
MMSRSSLWGLCLIATGTVASVLANQKAHHSLQILAGEKSGRFWSVWHGPQGTAVNPCNAEPFELVLETTDIRVQNSVPEDPPLLPKVTWGNPSENQPRPAALAPGECVINGNGQDGPPTLKCKDMTVDFKKDAQFRDAGIICDDNTKYIRTWTAEY